MSDRPAPPLLVAVGAAAAVGALARVALGLVLPGDGLPATLTANLSGCLLLGLLVGRAPAVSWVRPVLGTGLLGGWTTWSALAVQTDLLLADAPLVGLGYLSVSVVAGAALARIGLRLGVRRGAR